MNIAAHGDAPAAAETFVDPAALCLPPTQPIDITAIMRAQLERSDAD